MWTQRAGAPSKTMDWRMFSSQRMLSLCSIGTRVELILRLSAAVPLNCCRDQNFTAERPRGRPSGVTTRDACMRSFARAPDPLHWRGPLRAGQPGSSDPPESLRPLGAGDLLTGNVQLKRAGAGQIAPLQACYR